ncbi:MAG TPA: diguanylate cyclase [Rhodocyclaceae bacterium]
MSHNPQPLILWHTRFNTGHPQIDAQHRELVDMINRFAADVELGGSQHDFLFNTFREALHKHFLYEDTLLRQMRIPEETLAEHSLHHSESAQLLDSLYQELQDAPGDKPLQVLAEISHCLLEDLVDEDRFLFVSESTRSAPVGAPPVAPVLHAFGRMVKMLNKQQDAITGVRDYYLTLLIDFPTPVFRANAHGEFDWFNRTWLAFTGQTAEQASGYGWVEAVHIEEREALLRAWADCIAARRAFATEYRIADATGNWSWVHHIGQPFFDSDGAFLGYLCTFFDITERRRSEANLRVSAQVFEHATEAIMITDPQSRIEAINPAFTRITGYSAEEAIGQPSSLLRSGFHDAEFYAEMWHGVRTQGHWKGEVVNRRKDGELFPAWLSISTVMNSEGQVMRYVGVLNDITPLRTSRDHLMHLAHHDALTDLPNRLLFSARAEHSMERCARESGRLAVLFVDLDNFKPVNDTFGHKVGDQTLCQVAKLLAGALRDEDTVARLGGDEFVLLVERVDRLEDAQLVAQKLLDLFPLRVGDGTRVLDITASIGISLYPDDGTDIDTLLEVADKAMYRAKSAGGDQTASS